MKNIHNLPSRFSRTSRNSSSIKAVIVGLLLLLPVAITLGYYLGKKSDSTSTEVSTQSQCLLANEKIQADKSLSESKILDTTDWKKYQSKKYGFSFKYPDSFIVSESGYNLKLVPRSENKDFASTLTIKVVNAIPEILSARLKTIFGKEVEKVIYSGGDVYYLRIPGKDAYLQIFGASGSSPSEYHNDVFITIFSSITFENK